MKAVKVLACCALVFPLIGTGDRPLSRLRPRNSSPEQIKIRRAPTLALLGAGQELFRLRQYQAALQTFEKTRDRATADELHDLAARAAGNIGSCQFALHRYREALSSFTNAVHLAEQVNDRSAAAVFNANIASLYSELGELDSAAEWIETSLRRLSPEDRRDQEAKMLIQLASLRARQERMEDALPLFARGIAAADASGDLSLYANGYNRLGEEYLNQGDLPAAEHALLEAYRTRKLNKLPLDSSYRNLGLLRMEQGDLEAASVLLDRAVELAARPGGPIPTWDVFHQRGRVRLAQGRTQEALDDLRIARRLARAWRWNAPAGDMARKGTENWLDKVHSTLVEAGNQQYLKTHDPALIRETFEAAEENRASSLRALFAARSDTVAESMPAGYWEALLRLQQAEIQALRSPGAPAVQAVRASTAVLARMEVETAGATPPPPSELLERTRHAMDGDTAMMAFLTGEASSWLWCLGRDGLSLHRLPPRKELEEQVQYTAAAIQSGAEGAPEALARLYSTLFSGVERRFLTKSRWLVALDTGLFDVPLAALREGGRYLAEIREVAAIPGAGPWLESSAKPRVPSRLFVGVGDAIYNTADNRLPRQPGTASGALLLPRLVSSGKEVEACSRLWDGERLLLEGAAASRENLRQALDRNPQVVHLATHVLESSGPVAEGLIALSLTPRLESQLLPPREIAGWRTNAGVVVMSGCHSAQGAELRGTGMAGLTRAWLAAGARSVVASNWETPDEDGSLFRALYRHLSADTDAGPAAALRAAQLEMIQSQGWRAQPRYWGAYFAVGTP